MYCVCRGSRVTYASAGCNHIYTIVGVRRSSGLAVFWGFALFRTLSNLENIAQACIFGTCLEKTRLGATSGQFGSRKFGSGSLRGHLARESLAQGHFEATWLEKARLGVTPRPLASRKLFEETIRRNCSRELSRHH